MEEDELITDPGAEPEEDIENDESFPYWWMRDLDDTAVNLGGIPVELLTFDDPESFGGLSRNQLVQQLRWWYLLAAPKAEQAKELQLRLENLEKSFEEIVLENGRQAIELRQKSAKLVAATRQILQNQIELSQMRLQILDLTYGIELHAEDSAG